jgi:2-oxoglutarate/2-oxoacid ferredoxin oxidoreductase subunit alpha
MKKSLNILIGGEAGQGLVTIGELLAKTLVRSGYFIVVTQSYQSRIRGGHNTYMVRVSPEEIAAPREAIDLLVALDQNTLTLHHNEVPAEGHILIDQGFWCDGESCLKIPYKQMAPDRYSNTVALGVLGSLLGLDRELLLNTLGDFFGKKDPKVAEENRRVLAEAFRWGAEKPSNRRLPPPATGPGRMMMNGNEAIAFGAVSAGLRFYSFYPMTPATTIGQTLATYGGKLELVVEQAEDEIAAINMALGASFAGAPSMVGTSGGGFALMVEGVSLAAMTETPVVVIVAQRPGPATGLPTRTEQGDLNFVLHAGHGEFPRAVFAPGSVEECFELTRRAFFLAEKCQGPVFLLTDQFLADSSRATPPFQAEGLPAVRTSDLKSPPSGPYRRFALTQDGVSPRLIPGLTEHRVVAGSDEHTEDGHLTEDLAVRKAMVEKRLKKVSRIIREVVPPDYFGDKTPDLLFVSWGSAKGAVLEAAEEMRETGKTLGVLHFSQVWPLVPAQFLGSLQAAKQVVGIEGNATGQFAGLIRRESGFEIKKQIGRYDGLPITPEFILRTIKE